MNIKIIKYKTSWLLQKIYEAFCRIIKIQTTHTLTSLFVKYISLRKIKKQKWNDKEKMSLIKINLFVIPSQQT